MRVIGLVGGIASGKSWVSTQLQSFGACWWDADRAGHEVLRQDEVKASIRGRFGDHVFDAQGEVDRRALAQIVFAEDFGGSQALSDLEAITHPRIEAALSADLARFRSDGRCPIVVLDAPVLLKSGWDRHCDEIWFVEAADDVRLDRACARGWTEAEFRARERSQTGLDLKRRRASFIIDNTGSKDRALVQLLHRWRSTLDPST